ncbi:uncharacterized protein LOC121382153 [Gigantopelta aegis]|uniref:uncharacterized protein LOC121382153 n=1 Tax=Gigantopelta aegis TaxID=1735272 RepID=UPI001B888A59|nr:uncharacterized protein LOC121382153 [Gigantopelta aegis]
MDSAVADSVTMVASSPVHGSPNNGSTQARFCNPMQSLKSDVYLRHVLSSPCSKGYSGTPMLSMQHSSANSPVFKTPIRSAPLSNPKTPKCSRHHHVECVYTTPHGMVVNPFDTNERLHLPSCSPGLFTVTSTPGSDDGGTFRWNIEHIAALNPADIDEMPFYQDNVPKHFDCDIEERAQRAIENYFANHLIAPSPWSDGKKKYCPPTTPGSENRYKRPENMCPEDLQGSIQKELVKKRLTQDVSCQTTLTLPMNFDLQSILGEFMTFDKQEESISQADLSSSSLRRKLFFQGDTSSIVSPVKVCQTQSPFCVTSPQVSPAGSRQATPEWEGQTPYKTPNSGHFSSSPIRDSKEQTKYFHRSSETDLLASPELSPISKKHTESKISNSSRKGDPIIKFSLSPVGQNLFSSQPVDDMHLLPSPKMSPIQHSGHIEDLGSSFLQDNNQDYSADKSTPVAFNDREYPSPTLSPQPFVLMEALLNHSSISAVDAEKPMKLDLYHDLMYRSSDETFSGRDSITDMEINDHTAHHPSSTTQDTGYQTGSLQLTSGEMGLHSNLTNQFGSLPFKSESSLNSTESASSASKCIPRVCLHFTDEMESGGENDKCPQSNVSADSGMSEDNVLERARRVLAQANALCPSSSTGEFNINQSNVSSLEPIGSSTPTKNIMLQLEEQVDAVDKKRKTLCDRGAQLASDVALEILKRAGSDLAKYGSLQSDQQTGS